VPDADGRRTTDEELGDRDHAEHVRLEHLLDVRVRDRADLLAALDEAGVVDEHVDGAQLRRDAREQACDLCLVADVERERGDGAGAARGLRGAARVRDLLERVLPAREQDQVRAGLGALSCVLAHRARRSDHLGEQHRGRLRPLSARVRWTRSAHAPHRSRRWRR
jgi:hypothetical protein